jgi:uncharacterized membrane protein YkvA (DUF1232 family)
LEPSGLNALEKWKQSAQKVKAETYTLYLACRDPRTPWYAKLLAAGVVAYAVSPIDLIPDFVPVLGILDDLFIVPLGTLLAIRMVPKEVMVECREKAHSATGPTASKTNRYLVAAVVIAIWCLVLAFVVLLALRIADL